MPYLRLTKDDITDKQCDGYLEYFRILSYTVQFYAVSLSFYFDIAALC